MLFALTLNDVALDLSAARHGPRRHLQDPTRRPPQVARLAPKAMG
jgi:hypothetical protein